VQVPFRSGIRPGIYKGVLIFSGYIRIKAVGPRSFG
jgi:hypothetical protein